MQGLVKVGGIYDEKAFMQVQKAGICLFGFDFVTRSLNFLPQHNFLDMIKKHYNLKGRYYLKYSNEKDFIIWKMLDDLVTTLNISSSFSSIKVNPLSENFVLEFCDLMPSSFYNQFKIPFMWHFDAESSSLEEIMYADCFCGIVFDFDIFNFLQADRAGKEYLNSVFKIVQDLRREKKIEISISCPWNKNLSTKDFVYPIDYLSYAISSDVEEAYRTIDTVSLYKNLSRAIIGR